MRTSCHQNGDHASVRGPFPLEQQGAHVTTRVLPCADRITRTATTHRSGTPSPLYNMAHTSQRECYHAQIASPEWRPRIDPGPLPHCTTGNTRHNQRATTRISHHQNGDHVSIRDPFPIVQQGTHATTRVLPCADRIIRMATTHRSGTPCPLYNREDTAHLKCYHDPIKSLQWRSRIDPGPLPHCTTGHTRHHEGATMRRSHHHNGDFASIRDPFPIALQGTHVTTRELSCADRITTMATTH
jgi:hypothetical protein